MPRPGALALVGALLLALSAPAHAKPETFSLDVSPTAGTQDDTYVVTVQIEIQGVGGPERYWHPDFTHFTIVDTQSRRSTATTIDPRRGQRLRTSQIRRYIVRPNRAGRLRIGPARLRLKGEEFETRPAYVKVSAKGGGLPQSGGSGGADPTAAGDVGVPGFEPPSPARSGEEMFIHVVTDQDQVYVGDQVTVTWLLYTQNEVLKFEPRPPRLDGLWSETLYEPDSRFIYHDAKVGGRPYMVTIISKRAIFPTVSGEVEIKPYVARVASLGTALGRAQRLSSEAVEIDVEELPDGAPAGFDESYVGDFTVEAEADRTDIEADESLTLTVTVKAEEGAIRRTKPPRLSFPGFKFREPRDYDEKVEATGDVVGGTRVYRYWTTPKQGGQQTIPPIEIAHFDPETERYETARTDPIPIMVRGDPGEIEAGEGGSSRENVISRDIRLIQTSGSISSRTAPRFYRSPWFWVLAGFPALAFAVVVATDRVRQSLRKETPRARLRRARGRARQRFRVAEIHLRGNRPAKFFGELARVLYDHIEERLGQPIQSMTREEMREFLKKKGFAEPTIKRIDESLESFDFARFAPSAAGPEEMELALRRTQDLLRTIEKTRLADEAEGEGGAA